MSQAEPTPAQVRKALIRLQAQARKSSERTVTWCGTDREALAVLHAFYDAVTGNQRKSD